MENKFSTASRPAWPWLWRANNKRGQNRVSLKGIYVWGVQSKVTKQSDHYVWKDTSERVARRCDNTVDKKRVNSSVPKHLILERVEQPKISPKNPGNAFSDVLLMSCFQNFAADAAKTKMRFAQFVFLSIHSLIRINSGPKILRSCFIHCTPGWHVCHTRK